MAGKGASTPSVDRRDAGAEGSIGAACIRALLERASLPRHRHSAHIAELLDMSYHQAHRRLLGTAPWSLEELQVVAAHHGETLVDLLRGQNPANGEAAVLIAGPLRATCRIWPGEPVLKPRPDALIAVQGGLEWLVMVAGEAPTSQAFSVKRLVIEPMPDRPRRFAVLDNDAGVATELAARLTDLGFEAAAFVTEAGLQAALQSETFDAYVVDWMLAKGNATGIIEKIRLVNASVPIAVSVNTIGRKKVDEAALVAAITKYGLMYLQKPVTAAIAASQFRAAFSSR